MPSPTGPDLQDVAGEERQQRHRTSEQDRDEIERDRPEQHRGPPHESQSGQQRPQPRADDRRGSQLHRPRLDRDGHRRSREHERDRRPVDELGVDREEQPADRRPGHDRRLDHGRLERERAREQRQRDEVRPHRADRRVAERGRAAARERQREERPERIGAREADEEEARGDRRIDDERDEIDELAREPVRDRTRRQGEQEQREELRQADEPEMERVARDVVDLPADRDEHHLAPESVRDRRREQPRIVALLEHGWEPPPHRPPTLFIRCGRARSSARRGRTAAARRAARPRTRDGGAGDRPLWLRRREARCRPGGNRARARGGRAAHGWRARRARPPPSVR